LEHGVTQRNVEQLIGRLLTDEDFRKAFVADPEQALRDQTTNQIDARLQKARLKWPFIDHRD
jgi:putative modified peptide